MAICSSAICPGCNWPCRPGPSGPTHSEAINIPCICIACLLARWEALLTCIVHMHIHMEDGCLHSKVQHVQSQMKLLNVLYIFQTSSSNHPSDQHNCWLEFVIRIFFYILFMGSPISALHWFQKGVRGGIPTLLWFAFKQRKHDV